MGGIIMKKCQDVYMEPEILHLDNYTVRVFRPILTDEERERRMEKIKQAAAELLMSVERNKQKSKESK